MSIKEKLAQFWEDHKVAIAAFVGGTIGLAGWMVYVKHNTVDLPVYDIPGGKMDMLYDQFGERNMIGSTVVGGMADLAKMLVQNGSFTDNAEVFVVVSEAV